MGWPNGEINIKGDAYLAHLCAHVIVIHRLMHTDLPGVFHYDGEDASCVSSSDDKLSEHDLLDLGEGFALLHESADDHSDGHSADEHQQSSRRLQRPPRGGINELFGITTEVGGNYSGAGLFFCGGLQMVWLQCPH